MRGHFIKRMMGTHRRDQGCMRRWGIVLVWLQCSIDFLLLQHILRAWKHTQMARHPRNSTVVYQVSSFTIAPISHARVIHQASQPTTN